MTLRQVRREVATKSDRIIERETAQKWALRAIACYERASKATGKMRMAWLLRADAYKHEALEHGALVEDFGKTVAKLERSLVSSRRKHLRRG